MNRLGSQDDPSAPLDPVELSSRADRLSRFPRLLRQALRLVWSSARREFLVIAGLELLQGVGIAVQLLVGRAVLSSLLGAAQADSGFGTVAPVLVSLVGLTVLLSFAAAVQVEQSRVLGELVARRASERVIDVAGSVDLAAFEQPGFFDRLQRARMAALMRPVELVEGLGTLVTSAVTLAGIAAVLVTLQPVLALFLFVGYAPLWYAATRNSRALYEFELSMTEEDRRRIYLERVLCGRDEAKEIRAFQLRAFLRERYDRLYDARISKLRLVARRRMGRSLLAAAGSAGLTAAALGLISYVYVDGRLSLPTLGVVIAALLQLGAKLRGVTAGAGALYESALFVDDYESFMRLSSGAPVGAQTAVALPPFKRLVADRVTFTYPGAGEPALLDVSLEVRQGEVVALVGPNGSGKTTLAKLLACLYPPGAGRIAWDGVDVRTLDPDAARASVAVIFQDFVRYLLPARENIGAGRPARLSDSEAIVDAARAAGADDFLARLPQGYDTVLGKEFKDGTDLSIGEWQRLALARAFFRDAPFVILDEPTSAMDATAEQELFERIRSLFEHRSVLLISHRFSSVRSADRIYVLDRGRIVEHGIHDELMEHAGTYAAMFTAQAAAYLSRPTENR